MEFGTFSIGTEDILFGKYNTYIKLDYISTKRLFGTIPKDLVIFNGL